MRKFSFTDVIAALFILLFIYAAFSKLADYSKFRVQLGLSPMLTNFASWVAWIIPSAEIIIAMLLVSERFRLSALYASFLLMVIFSAYIIVLKNFSEFVPCSCGGILQNMSWNEHLAFNICFVLLGAVAILLYKSEQAGSNQLN